MTAKLSITTLKNRPDFLRLNRGHKFITPSFILRALPSEQPDVRVGYTVTTKCGNAVVRNRIKRRLRALVRELFPAQARAATDYVIIARADAELSPADCAVDELRGQFTRALSAIHKKFPE
jgi:ribonuclease P protein component